jgi:hypothetical protein
MYATRTIQRYPLAELLPKDDPSRSELEYAVSCKDMTNGVKPAAFACESEA